MDFNAYLKASGEVGYVAEIVHFIVYAEGIPSAKMGEIIVFEDGEIGQVFGLNGDMVEILLLSKSTAKVGEKLTLTGLLSSSGASSSKNSSNGSSPRGPGICGIR